jgi:hypothetical protein
MTAVQSSFGEGDVAGQRYFYSCFGLRIESDIHFLELDPADPGSADLRIRLASASGQDGGGMTGSQVPSSVEKVMDFTSVGRFHITPNMVTITPAEDVRPEDLGLPLFGPVLATVLHQRGLLVLHGSAISSKWGLIAFVGDSGAGKSTTAGWFATNVAPLFTDDLLPVTITEDGTPLVLPGYPLIKLSSAAVEAFVPVGTRILPVGIEGYPKLRVRLDRPTLPSPGALDYIFVLRRGEEAAYSPFSRTDALRAVMRNSYMAKYPDAFSSPERKIRHLQQSTAVANNVRIGELTVPSSLDRLHEVLPLLESL